MNKTERQALDDIIKAENFSIGYMNIAMSKYEQLKSYIDEIIRNGIFDSTEYGISNSEILSSLSASVNDYIDELEDEKRELFNEMCLYLYLANSALFSYQLLGYGFQPSLTIPDKITIPEFQGESYNNRLARDTTYLKYNIPRIIARKFTSGVKLSEVMNEIDVVFKTSFNSNVGTMFRSYTNIIVNMAKLDSYKNSDVERYVYSAILDSSTTEICESLNGRIFLVSEAQPFVNYPPMHYNCYHKDTEVYTDSGWKMFNDVDISKDKFASINMTTNNLEFVKARRLIKQKSDKLIHFKSNNYDLLVTPNHNMLAQNMDSSLKNHPYKFKIASEISNKSKWRFPRTADWNGNHPDTVNIAGKDIETKLYVKFMAYWLADGSCTDSYKIKIAQCDNDWMFKELSGFPWKINKYDDSLQINNKELGQYLNQFGKCTEKYIPNEILNFDKELIKIFLDAYSLTDGTIQKGKNWKNYNFNDHIIFYTTSDKLAYQLGELILKAGGCPKFDLKKCKGKEIKFRNGTYIINHDCWSIHWNTNDYAWASSMDISEVYYNDYSYCVELEKNNTLWVRYNGRTTFCGNCRSTTYPANSTGRTPNISFEDFIDNYGLSDNQIEIVRRYFSI